MYMYYYYYYSLYRSNVSLARSTIYTRPYLPHLFCCAFILACCLTSYDMVSSHDGISCFDSTNKVSRSRQTFLLRSLKNDVARPRFPTRPVRPIRCTYSSMSLGRSKLTTCFTLGMSSPLAATYGKFQRSLISYMYTNYVQIYRHNTLGKQRSVYMHILWNRTCRQTQVIFGTTSIK